MKKSIILTFLLFICTLAFSQSSDEAVAKRVLQGRLNEIFHRWDDNWSADRYLDETALISYFEESDYSMNTIIAHGTFTVKRTFILSTTVNVKFTSKIRVDSNGATTIVNVCYQDSSTGMRDCCDPSLWGLESL